MRGHSLGSSVREKIMRPLFKAILFAAVALFAALLLKPGASVAGDIILSHNTGGESEVFFIENEPSLVINGFDLTPYTAQFPVGLDAVSISVSRAAPTTNIELVVYQDANGGSPVDATLIHRQPVTIDRSGFHRFQLSEAAIVTEPVVWVGFYLPVGFRFHADVSGPSVLTYWAWTPGAAFDISSLASAPVLGPGDGTDPVSIDMQGIARITAEMRPLFHQEMESDTLLGHQLVAEGEQDTSAMGTYPHCGGLLHDPEDISVTSSSSFTIHCELKSEFEAPIEVVNPDGRLLDLQRAGHLYKLDAQIPQAQLVHGAVNTLPVPVTHCMSIQPGDLEQAVIAEGRGIPERWHVLPSVRFGEMVCAEITTASYLSYFLPRGAGAPPNVNLALGWTTVNPHPIECGLPAYVSAPVVNTGQSWFSTVSGNVKFIIENIHVRSGTITGAVERSVETSKLGPGMRHLVHFAPIYVTSYVNELHRLQVRADFDNQIQETNEDDNVWFTEYILSNAQQSDRCFNIPWLTATPTDLAGVEGICLVSDPLYRRGDLLVIPHSPACEIEFRSGTVTVRETSASVRTIRGCEIRIHTEVVGRKATVRYQIGDDCNTPGGFRHYRNRNANLLIIDHDRPTPTPTVTPFPGIPYVTGLTADGRLLQDDIMFSWNAVMDSAVPPGASVVGYNLQYRAAGEVWESIQVTPPATTHTLTIPLADKGANYYWRVQVDIGMGPDRARLGPWAEGFVRTSSVAAPTGLVGNDIRNTADVRFRWSLVAGVTSYQLQYRVAGTNEWLPETPVPFTVGSDRFPYEYKIGLPNKGKRYEWQLRAVVDTTEGPWARGGRFNTSSIPAPDDLNAEDTPDTDEVEFSWSPVSIASNYEYRYCFVGNNCDDSDGTNWVDGRAVGGSTTSVTVNISHWNRGRELDWQVRIENSAGDKGRWISGDRHRTMRLPAPASLAAADVAGSNNVRFSWAAVHGADAASYLFQTRPAGEDEWESPTAQSGSDSTVDPIVHIIELDKSKTHQWRVRASAGGPVGEWSAIQSWSLPSN